MFDSPYLFPIFFAAIWVGASTILGWMSGWFNLQQWYPEPTGEPLLKLRGQSGSMGLGVALNGVLRLTAYPAGLGVGIWRVFGPFQRTFLVPWSEIGVEESRSFFTPMVKLSFGNPPNGRLKISMRSWSKLVAAAKPATTAPLPAAPEVSRAAVARRMFLEWLVLTTIGATFFLVVSHAWDSDETIPVAFCIGLPAIMFGISQLIRFARES